jgi:transposase
MERMNRLEERYLTLARLHFGQSSEKLSTIEANSHISFDPLTNTVTEEKECSSKEQTTTDTSSTQQRKTGSRVNHKGRNGFPSRLTRHTIEHDVPAHQKICNECGSFLSLIGYEEREQLETSIEQYSVLLHKRRKYACKNKNCCGGTIVTAPMPAEPIEKGSAGSNLLAEVIVGKYVDHMPLYRLEKRFARKGITLNRSTLWSWIDRSTILLEPLVNAMIDDQQKATHLFSDETTIPTLWAQIPENKGKQAKINYFWVYTSLLNDDKNHPIVIYRFCEGRGS